MLVISAAMACFVWGRLARVLVRCPDRRWLVVAPHARQQATRAHIHSQAFEFCKWLPMSVAALQWKRSAPETARSALYATLMTIQLVKLELPREPGSGLA